MSQLFVKKLMVLFCGKGHRLTLPVFSMPLTFAAFT